MSTYLILLRGINVGGKNKIPMADLKQSLEEIGFSHVSTYIASGNVILESDHKPDRVKAIIESALTKNFKLDSKLIKVLVLTQAELQAVIKDKPSGFGERPKTYHSDVIFLIDSTADEAMPFFDPREGVDSIWAGDDIIYFQRLSSQRTKSRLSKIVAKPIYKSMTIRNWNTTTKLLRILKERKKDEKE